EPQGRNISLDSRPRSLREGRLLCVGGLSARHGGHALRLGGGERTPDSGAGSVGVGARSTGQGTAHLHLRGAVEDHHHRRRGARGEGRAVPGRGSHRRGPAYPRRHRLHRAEPRHPGVQLPACRARGPHRARPRPDRRALPHRPHQDPGRPSL
ncbi:MAG: hypothetical protein AVDCRST_MAG25-2545, partial [uncultured Rubrobacteraceae bacterium]